MVEGAHNGFGEVGNSTRKRGVSHELTPDEKNAIVEQTQDIKNSILSEILPEVKNIVNGII
jgi:hypothetical protein